MKAMRQKRWGNMTYSKEGEISQNEVKKGGENQQK